MVANRLPASPIGSYSNAMMMPSEPFTPRRRLGFASSIDSRDYGNDFEDDGGDNHYGSLTRSRGGRDRLGGDQGDQEYDHSTICSKNPTTDHAVHPLKRGTRKRILAYKRSPL